MWATIRAIIWRAPRQQRSDRHSSGASKSAWEVWHPRSAIHPACERQDPRASCGAPHPDLSSQPRFESCIVVFPRSSTGLGFRNRRPRRRAERRWRRSRPVRLRNVRGQAIQTRRSAEEAARVGEPGSPYAAAQPGSPHPRVGTADPRAHANRSACGLARPSHEARPSALARNLPPSVSWPSPKHQRCFRRGDAASGRPRERHDGFEENGAGSSRESLSIRDESEGDWPAMRRGPHQRQETNLHRQLNQPFEVGLGPLSRFVR